MAWAEIGRLHLERERDADVGVDARVGDLGRDPHQLPLRVEDGDLHHVHLTLAGSGFAATGSMLNLIWTTGPANSRSALYCLCRCETPSLPCQKSPKGVLL